jgi:SNF2 family DNA or RNA helicase
VEIIDNKAILLRLRHPERITNLIPKSRLRGDNEVLVHWGLDEVLVLKNMGIDVPSPITGRYAWRGQYKPFDHQKTTAEFLTLNKRAFCFNEQGTGKTGAAIWASDYLLTLGKINRVLVVCPLSIMDSAWRDDMFNFAMHRTVEVAHGSKHKREQVLSLNTDYVIINYDGIEVVFDAISKGGFDLIIIDEATHYKNARTDRWKVMNKLVSPDTWVWQMTGTPAAQSPLDAHGLARLSNKDSVPRSFNNFRDQVMLKLTQFKWVPKHNSSEVVHRILQPAIRFTKEECLDLPEMVYVTRDVVLSRQQSKYYKALKDKLVIQAAGEEVTASNAAIAMGKLLQIALGATYTDTKEVLHFDIADRYKVLREVIAESSKKVLVFAPYKNVIHLIANKLTADGISNRIISGDVPASERTAIFREFQNTDTPQVLVIQPQSAAHGVTLTAANTIVWWGPTSSLETWAQANARVHRAGQDHKCTVVKLRGSPVEKHIYSLLDNRVNLHTKIIDLYKQILD